MSLLSAPAFKQHYETDLDSDAIQRLLNSEESEIARRFGPVACQTDYFEGSVQGPRLWLSRRADTAQAIAVTETIFTTDTTLTLDTDFRFTHDGSGIERLYGPILFSWGWRVIATYAPLDDTARRIRVLIDLVKLCIQYNALTTETVGDYKSQSKTDYQQERENLLSTLEAGGALPFA